MDFRKEYGDIKPFEREEVIGNDFSFAFDGLDKEDLSSDLTGDFDTDYSNYIAMRKGKKSTAARFKKQYKIQSKKIVEKPPVSIFVPTNRDVTILGSQNLCYETMPDKFNSIVLTIDNTNSFDITVDLFRPSSPYLYTQSTRLNINDLIIVGGGETILYTDMLAYLTANITRLKTIRVDATLEAQMNKVITCKSMNFKADQLIIPKPLFQSIYQIDQKAVEANLDEILLAPFIVDGLQFFQYTILAGCKVNLGFDFTQVRLKDLLIDEV